MPDNITVLIFNYMAMCLSFSLSKECFALSVYNADHSSTSPNLQVFNSCSSDNRKIKKASTFNSSFIIYTQHPLVKKSMSAKVTIDFNDQIKFKFNVSSFN